MSYDLNGFDIFLSIFSIEVMDLHVFVVVFLTMRPTLMS